MNFFIFRGVVGDQNCPIRAILLVNVSVLYLKKTLSNDLQNDFWPLIHVKSFQSSNITWYKVHIPICSHLKVGKSGLKWAIHSWILLFLWKWPNQWVTVGYENHFFPYQKLLGKIWPLKALLCLFYPISLGSILRLSDKMLYIFAAHSTSTQRPYLIFIVGTDCPVQSIASGTKHKSTRTS